MVHAPAPPESELREAIRKIYAMQGKGKPAVRSGTFAGALQCSHHISLRIASKRHVEITAGDKRLTGAGGWRIWKFDKLPSEAEAYATVAEHFDAIDAAYAEQERIRKAELAAFYARHGQHELIAKYCQ